MQSREAKYCLDQNHIKWSLVEGVITRKGAQDGPQDGQTLPTSEIKTIEKTHLTLTHRSPMGWPVTLIGLAILGLSLLLISVTWLLAAPGIVFGLLLLVWGVKRIPAQTETIAAFRIVAPVQNPGDWVMVGDVPEVVGFLDGVRADMEVENRQKQPA
jgi:hypothetical protein